MFHCFSSSYELPVSFFPLSHFPFVASYPSFFFLFYIITKKILWTVTASGHLCGFWCVCVFAILCVIFLSCMYTLSLVISLVFVFIYVTLLAVGLLFWPYRPSTHISIHHSLQAHPQASLRHPVPHPTCRGSLVSPRAPHRACGQGHWVMDSSVGGKRPEGRHMLADAHKDTHTRMHKDQQGLSPTSCTEREGGGNGKEEGTPNRHN